MKVYEFMLAIFTGFLVGAVFGLVCGLANPKAAPANNTPEVSEVWTQDSAGEPKPMPPTRHQAISPEEIANLFHVNPPL